MKVGKSIWNEIEERELCDPLIVKGAPGRLLITRDSAAMRHWVVGDHPSLSRLARRLRHDVSISAILRERDVAFGFRVGDVPPFACPPQASYGPPILGTDDNHNPERIKQILPPVSSSKAKNRITDRLQNVRAYWERQTPQAHHIVEFNSLAALGVSRWRGTRDLDYRGLPCVLLIAEFHQRYVSSHLKTLHHAGNNPGHLLGAIKTLYKSIYLTSGSQLKSIWSIASIILDATERKVGGRVNG